jgi:hypothetical protein
MHVSSSEPCSYQVKACGAMSHDFANETAIEG